MYSCPPFRLFVNCAIALSALIAPRVNAASDVIDQGRSDTVPWSGPWWPQREGALPAVLEKFDEAFGTRAAAWHRRRFPTSPDIPPWYGICHGWAASATLEAEPRDVVVIPASSHTLSIDEQKGLLALSHTNDIANVYGVRNDGPASDEPETDFGPDQLWFLLQRYVRDRRVPLILDLDAGPAVWNFPVFRYEVAVHARLPDGRRRATLTIWVAQTSPKADFVGTLPGRKSYSFAYREEQGTPVLGSGEWLGASRQDHPDFAWYPFVAASSNPHLDNSKVRRLLAGATADPLAPPSNTREPSVPALSDELSLLSSREVEYRVFIEDDDGRFRPWQKGQPLRSGQRFRITVKPARSAYLYVTCTNASGRTTTLVPHRFEPAPLARAESTLELPSDVEDFTLDPPGGVERLVIIASERRLTVAQTAHLDELPAAGVIELFHD